MRKFAILVFMLVAVAAQAQQDSVNVTIQRAPYDVPNDSSKSERATITCPYCGSKVRYDRKYRWDKKNELDRKIEVEKTKARISSKEKKLQRLRNANR